MKRASLSAGRDETSTLVTLTAKMRRDASVARASSRAHTVIAPRMRSIAIRDDATHASIRGGAAGGEKGGEREREGGEEQEK